MKLKFLLDSLDKLGLSVVRQLDGNAHSVVLKGIANPMLFFKVNQSPEEYHGSLNFKSINTRLFTEKQIREALLLVDEYLQTPIEQRENY